MLIGEGGVERPLSGRREGRDERPRTEVNEVACTHVIVFWKIKCPKIRIYLQCLCRTQGKTREMLEISSACARNREHFERFSATARDTL